MEIGINAAASIKYPRTGVEEYTYQLIKHLAMLPEARQHRFSLYLHKVNANVANEYVNAANKISPNPPFVKGGDGGIFDFPLPGNFEIKELKWSLPMWTQMRLASEMLFHKPDVLFIPVHILPRFHPQNSVVTIHGLEYEYFPQYYPFWSRNYLRASTKYAVKNARRIIAVSQNTKNDLVKLYGAKPEKIEVVHHGIEIKNQKLKTKDINQNSKIKKPYLLYIGRIELKKNILGILEAYKILKEKYKIPHKLVLAGEPGFGQNKINLKIKNLKLKIFQPGYISEEEKWRLLSNANVFLFPSFYEGFGLPVLEAQAAGVPVVTSNNSSMPEVAGRQALLVNPKNPEEIAQTIFKLIDDNTLRDKLIQLGFENVKRFSWEECAKETLKVLIQ